VALASCFALTCQCHTANETISDNSCLQQLEVQNSFGQVQNLASALLFQSDSDSDIQISLSFPLSLGRGANMSMQTIDEASSHLILKEEIVKAQGKLCCTSGKSSPRVALMTLTRLGWLNPGVSARRPSPPGRRRSETWRVVCLPLPDLNDTSLTCSASNFS
jgi:hypothetical protein